MLRVQANVDAIDSELVIARKVCVCLSAKHLFVMHFCNLLAFLCVCQQLLTRVVKSLASDKILVLFLCLISVVICGVVVMSVTKKF